MHPILKWLLAIPMLAALIVPILGWQLETRRMQRGWSQKMSRNRKAAIPIRTAMVMENDGADVVGATCVSQPSSVVAIMQAGYNNKLPVRVVTEVNFQEGERVKEGDVLVRFDPHLFQQSVIQAQSRVELAQDQVANLRRIITEGAASNLELATAIAELEDARLMLEKSKKDLEECTIVSPFDGVMGDIKLAPSARVPTQGEVCVVFKLDPVLIRVDFPIERLESVQIGDEMEVVFDSFPNETHKAKVVRIAPNAKSQTRVVSVFLEIPNPDYRLKGGITGYARLSQKKRAITVPRTAVIRRRGKAVVFKVVNDTARLVEVEIGPMIRDGELELLAGLNAGDEIVVFGHDELIDGDKVNSNWQRWANRDDLIEKQEGLYPPLESIDEKQADEQRRDSEAEFFKDSSSGKPSSEPSKAMESSESSELEGPTTADSGE